jgi:UDP-N-acetylmuramoylalanine--D-glutamate ligase
VTLAGRRVLVVGLARSGLAAAKLAHRLGARVAVSDGRDTPALRALIAELGPRLERSELGAHTAEMFAWADVILASPGVPLALPLFDAPRARGAEIIGEVELAFRHFAAPIVGITGAKGKSTTTALAGEMLRAAGKRTFVGGNLGTPFAEALLDDRPLDVAVVELSSFQLETVADFRPAVAALLNLAPDHQDRYACFEDYVLAKLRLFAKQTPADAAVFNAADAPTMARVGAARGRVYTFGTPDSNAWRDGDSLRLRLDAEETIDVRAFAPPGAHNKQNLEAAALLARLAGADADAIARGAASFRGLAHRLEPIAEIDGVLFIDDSKATTPGAVRTALHAMTRPVVLILGGRDKGGDWATLADDAAACRGVVLYGEAAHRIAAALAPLPVFSCTPFAEALAKARGLARPGDVVLLSPGCASFDQFTNAEERGETMRRWVLSQ